MEAAATAAGDAAAFENGVLRRQVADLRQAAHAERQVEYSTIMRSRVLMSAVQNGHR